MKHGIICGVALSSYWAALLCGQTELPSLTFEVASVKLTSPNTGGTSIQIQPGGLNVTNATLKMLITTAYDVRDFQVSGGPAWITSDRYDVIAKSDLSKTPITLSDLQNMNDQEATRYIDQIWQRLRSLLADRFQLVIHHEEKEAAVYTLVVAKSGARIKLAPEARKGSRGLIRGNKGQLIATGVSMDMLATSLSNQVGHPVLDKTELKGNFDFKLEWTPEQGAVNPSAGLQVVAPVDPNGTSIFTAVQEQLGLRLESRKAPVQTIVIDHAEKPSGN